MTLFRNILVGCDGSESAFDALALAEQLRDREAGRLILASVYPFYRGLSAPALASDYGHWLRDQAERALERVAERVTTDVPVECQTISDSSVAGGINDLAESMGADLIVLGSTGRGSLAKLTGRTTVGRLLHGAPCPVAVAAPGQDRRFGQQSQICVAYDASPEARHALDTAYGIAAATDARVVICDVLEPIAYQSTFPIIAQDARFDEHRKARVCEELDAAAARAPERVPVESRFVVGVPADATLRTAGPDVDLIVAGSRGYGALHRAIAGSVSGTLLANGQVPVLVTGRVPSDAASLATLAMATS